MTGRTHWKYCAGMLVCRMQEMQLVKRQHLVLGPRSGQKNTLPESEVHCLKSVGDHTEAPLDGRTDGCHSVVELGFRSMGCRVDEGSKQLLHQSKWRRQTTGTCAREQRAAKTWRLCPSWRAFCNQSLDLPEAQSSQG